MTIGLIILSHIFNIIASNIYFIIIGISVLGFGFTMVSVTVLPAIMEYYLNVNDNLKENYIDKISSLTVMFFQIGAGIIPIFSGILIDLVGFNYDCGIISTFSLTFLLL